MAVVKNLMIRGGADFSKVTKETNKANQQLSRFGARASKSLNLYRVAMVAATGAVAIVIKDSIGVAAKYEASIQQISRTMGDNASGFMQWANAQSTALNMGKADAMQYGAVYSNLVSGFSKDTSETMKNTQDLLKASAIVSSATGRSMSDTMERIKSGLLGNTESIEDLGINVNVAMIESTNAFKKFAGSKSWQKLDYQTQQQIRLMAILEQANKKYGDSMADNTNTRMLGFVAQLKNIQLGLGQAFLPIVNAVLPHLTAMAQGLSNVVGLMAQFTGALFGTDVKFGSQTEDQANAVSDLGDSYKDAGKKAKGALGSFDEINAISIGDGGGGPAASTSTPTAAVDESSVYAKASEEIKKMGESVKAFFAPLKDINFSNILTAIGGLKTALIPLTDTLFAGLKWGMDNVIAPMAKFTIENIVPAFIDLLSGALRVLNPLIEAFKPLALFLFNDFLLPIAKFTGGVIITVLTGLADALTKIGDWMSANITTIQNATTAVAGFFGAWLLVDVMAFMGMGGSIVSGIIGVANAFKTATLAMAASKAETIALKLLYAKDFIVMMATSTGAVAKQTAAWLANGASVVASKVAYVASAVAAKGMAIAQGALNVVMNANPFILVATLVAGLVVALITLWNTNEGFRKAVIGAWEAIKKTATSVFDGVKNAIVGGVNAGIESINNLIKLINKIPGIEIPTMKTIDVGTGTTTTAPTVTKIPKMATGGIVNGATQAIIGEAGAEAIVPLENSSFIDSFAKKVASMVGTGSDMPSEIVLKIGESEFGRVAIKSINKIQRQHGATLLEV